MNANAGCITDRQAALTLNSIGDAVLSTDLPGKVTYLNPVAERMTGWSRQEALGRPLAEVLRIIDATTREAARNPLEQAIELDTVVGLTPNCLLIGRDGFETAIEDSASPIHDRGGLVIGAVIVFRDVSEARARSRQAVHLAHHDALTALPNRTLLDDRLTDAMAGARRHGHRLAVLFLDLDRFKHVNDSRGHMAGDMVLQSVAHRLVACVRNTDTVSRQGGDEFVVLLPEIAHADDAAVSAQEDPRRVRGAARCRAAAVAPDRHHRHQPLPRRRPGRADAGQASGHGDVLRQEQRPEHLSVLRAADGHAGRLDRRPRFRLVGS